MSAMTQNVVVSLVAIYGRLWVARPITSINDSGKYNKLTDGCQEEKMTEEPVFVSAFCGCYYNDAQRNS